ncbi:calcitonin protein-related peptide type 1 receptor-like isoform X1 [Vespula squamosa]|uniref:Calcitonin protein-related peptide type 1 receptor-like isoform X1 n=1 Tax=Vespula squamosa TaxID=30214 RepID=A0ABD2BDW9_VESSQ
MAEQVTWFLFFLSVHPYTLSDGRPRAIDDPIRGNVVTLFMAMKAHKYCEINGTWFRHPVSHTIWSNYTTCINIEDLIWQQGINGIYEVGYAISLVALLLSLVILTYFRSLRCARITLHMNLFVSFVLNNALWLIWYRFVVANTNLLLTNSIICRLLHILLHYFLLTNYAWMLCEGFYLHTLLVLAFTSEHRLVNWLMALGWSMPGIIVTIYAILRTTSYDPMLDQRRQLHECVSLSGMRIDVVERFISLQHRTCSSDETTCWSSDRNETIEINASSFQSNDVIGTTSWSSLSSHSVQAAEEAPLGTRLRSYFSDYSLFPSDSPVQTEMGRYDAATETSEFLYGHYCLETNHPCRANDNVPKSSPFWDVDCFSLSARPQVRWRERRRCDYQSAMSVEPDKYEEDDHRQRQSVMQLVARRESNIANNNSHANVLLKRTESINEPDQTQC